MKRPLRWISLPLAALVLLSCGGTSKGQKQVAKASKPANCFTLDLSRGFQTAEEFETALGCIRTSGRFPALIDYIDSLPRRTDSDSLRLLANDLLKIHNLRTLTDILARWQSLLGAETVQDFSASFRPLFAANVWPSFLKFSRKVHRQPHAEMFALHFLNSMSTTLGDARRSGSIRSAVSEWFETEGSRQFLASISGILNGDFQSALEKTTRTVSAGEFRIFVDRTVELLQSKSIDEYVSRTTPEQWKSIFAFAVKSSPGLAEIADVLTSMDHGIFCDPAVKSVPTYSNGSEEILKRSSQDPKLLSDEIAKLWPRDLCGITKKEIHTLNQLEKLFRSKESSEVRRLITTALRSKEETRKLIEWAKELHRARLEPIWVPWLKGNLERNTLDPLMEGWKSAGTLAVAISNDRTQPLNAFLLGTLLNWGASPNEIFHLEIGDLAVLMNAWKEDLIDLPGLLKPLLEEKAFVAARTLLLAMVDQDKLPKTFVETMFSVLDNPIADQFTTHPLPMEAAVEGIRLLVSYQTVYQAGTGR